VNDFFIYVRDAIVSC